MHDKNQNKQYHGVYVREQKSCMAYTQNECVRVLETNESEIRTNEPTSK